MKTFTVEEVAKHNNANDIWIIIDGKVFDVTKFLNEHPGGKKVLLKMAGKDATKKFEQFHNAAIMQKVGLPMQIGVIGEAKPTEQEKKPQVSEQVGAAAAGAAPALGQLVSSDAARFGEGIPYGDPTWYQDWNRQVELLFLARNIYIILIANIHECMHAVLTTMTRTSVFESLCANSSRRN